MSRTRSQSSQSAECGAVERAGSATGPFGGFSLTKHYQGYCFLSVTPVVWVAAKLTVHFPVPASCTLSPG